MTSINVIVPGQDSTGKTVLFVSSSWGFFLWNGATSSYHHVVCLSCGGYPLISPSCSLSLSPAEFLTRIKLLLKPTPNTVHYILTHFKGVWNIVNNIPFLRNLIMRYVLTCKYKPPWFPASSNKKYALKTQSKKKKKYSQPFQNGLEIHHFNSLPHPPKCPKTDL